MKHDKDMELVLSSAEGRDIDGFLLAGEMESLKPIISQSIQNDPIHILQMLAPKKR